MVIFRPPSIINSTNITVELNMISLIKFIQYMFLVILLLLIETVDKM